MKTVLITGRSSGYGLETGVFQSLLHALCLIVVINVSASDAIAQDRLPAELNRNSSLSEILAWLDKTSFAYARVGLDDSYEDLPDDPSSTGNLVFSQGFKLTLIDGCHLTLRNEAIQILDFSRQGDDVANFLERRKGNTAGQLFMWLERLSYDKGRAPYRHTADPDKAKLLGAWRTKFTFRGFFGKDVFDISLGGPNQGEMKVIHSATLTLTFDDREMGERFNAAFRQAIKLCQNK
jgi:hypothetical protein